MEPKTIYLSIAGFTIELILHPTEYIQTKNLFLMQLFKIYKGFIKKKVNSSIDFTIRIVQDEHPKLLKYKEKNYIEYYEVTKNISLIITFYSVSLVQFSDLIRHILFHLLKRTGFFMHGAVAIYKKEALLYLGHSKEGKSTTLTILKKDIKPFADDIFIIRKIKKQFFCYQSHFLDKQTWIKKESKGYLIKKIFFLKKDKRMQVKKTNNNKMKKILLNQLIATPDTLKYFLTTLFQFIKYTYPKSYLLFSNRNKEELKKIIENT